MITSAPKNVLVVLETDLLITVIFPLLKHIRTLCYHAKSLNKNEPVSEKIWGFVLFYVYFVTYFEVLCLSNSAKLSF